MVNELSLTDLIDVETLQLVQDAFSEMTGMAALTTDRDGKPITEGSNFTEFCMRYTRQTKLGCKRCQYCDRRGAEIAMDSGTFSTYMCHAGLVDFAAPIIANGTLVGSFIGGQVLTADLDERRMRAVAYELDIDEEEYLSAARKVKILDKTTIDRSARFLWTISTVLSKMAYNTYQLHLGNIEIEKAARMKSDFLANMSHEIRTPMNAVIGMAEMALRENLSPNARDYISQIKSSGQTLLTIINDILDFSKIESGKMDIVETEYEPLSMIHDIVGIILNRIGDKNLELILDIPPELPHELYGDSIRIKQIIVNLMNNAVKFTKYGEIHFKVECEPYEEDSVMIKMYVKDTGQGIKKEDMQKLFRSFQQVDSKRNRNIEGTGLGLAISKQLLDIMGGSISVESEYGVGSTFFFQFPQKIIDARPSIKIPEESSVVATLLTNAYIREQLKLDAIRLGQEYVELSVQEELEIRKIDYLFFERSQFSEYIETYLQKHPEVTGVLLVDYKNKVQNSLENLRIITKPLYALNLVAVLNHQELFEMETGAMAEDVHFVAPDAKILIVDDNEINLTVAKGLLEPLCMQIDTAISGKDAISKISNKVYDLIFMDHMMPEVDGVETTHIIRRFYEEYKNIPIIALTANAIGGTKEMFLKEGMNDFVPKPIEMKVIASKLKQWLPPEKIRKADEAVIVTQETGNTADEGELVIEGLDIQAALALLGSKKLLMSVIADYYRAIEKKSAIIKEYEEQEKWREYTIEVHALKSASRQIGAMALADKAERMEMAGNAENAELIHQCTDEVVAEYRWYRNVLEPYVEDKDTVEGDLKFTIDTFLEQQEKMREALEELDSDLMEDVIKELGKYHMPDAQKKYYQSLKNAVDDIDTEACESILLEWEHFIKKGDN